MARIRKRFIAGSVCPECKDDDSLMLYEEDGQEHVECVSCDYKISERDATANSTSQPTAENEQVIGYFKP